MKLEKKEVQIKRIDYSLAKDIILKNHYSHRVPMACMLNLGVYYKKRLVGCMMFNSGACNRYHKLIKGAKQNRNMELIRLWTEDNLPCGLITRAIGISLKLIKKQNPLLEFIISFADEAFAGHVGTIYKASNFIYCGSTTDIKKEYLINGKVYHDRSLDKLFGTSRIDLIREKNTVEEIVRKNKKHRYIYPFKEHIREEVLKLKKPHPAPVV